MQDAPSFGTLNYSICIIYLGVMFGIGIYFAKKQKTTEDFFLAGRQMPWFIVAISLFVSLSSAASYMAIPGIAYMENISYIIVGVMYIAAAPFLIRLILSLLSKT